MGSEIASEFIWKYSVFVFPGIITEKFWSIVFNIIPKFHGVG